MEIPPVLESKPLPPVLEKKRYHDLDALRASAMLLGIVLHAIISFMGEEYWPIQDTQSPAWIVPKSISESGERMGMALPETFSPYKFGMQAIHGFRMPLFFLVSGFFTAMLWRSRGMKELLKHRAKRILLPLAAAGAVIIPATWGCMFVGAIIASVGGPAAAKPSQDLWSAAAAGDVGAIHGHLKRGAEVNALDKNGRGALISAAFTGELKAVEALLESGAEVNLKNRDQSGGTALHTAAFMGRVEIVELLLAKGADAHLQNNDGQTALQIVSGEWSAGLEGVYKFIGSITNTKMDLDRIKAARPKVAEVLRGHAAKAGGGSELDANATGNKAKPEEQSDGDFVKQIYEDLPGWGKVVGVVVGVIWGLSMLPIFHHLWFLFYLVVMILIFAGVVWLAGKFKLREWPAWVVASPARWLWLLPLTFLAQVTMWQSFGPDVHPGFIPWPPKVLYYFLFFGFGALCYGRPEFEEKAGRYWPIWFLCAVPFLLAGVGFFETRNGLVLSDWRGNQAAIVRSQLILSACAVAYTWLMIFGLIGFFRKCFSTANKTVRYISDSSYWLYLAHMPVIFILQGLVARWEAPSLLKCFLICALTFGGLLVVYELVIRYTFIGTMLNGKRTREQSPA